MEIDLKYVVYRTNKVVGSVSHLALEEVKFSGWTQNSFETEEDAIEAIKNDDLSYENLLIIRQVCLRT